MTSIWKDGMEKTYMHKSSMHLETSFPKQKGKNCLWSLVPKTTTLQTQSLCWNHSEGTYPHLSIQMFFTFSSLGSGQFLYFASPNNVFTFFKNLLLLQWSGKKKCSSWLFWGYKSSEVNSLISRHYLFLHMLWNIGYLESLKSLRWKGP